MGVWNPKSEIKAAKGRQNSDMYEFELLKNASTSHQRFARSIINCLEYERTLIGASKDFATLTITGVKKTQNISYTKRPPCNSKMFMHSLTVNPRNTMKH